jgi:hypothetical protein
VDDICNLDDKFFINNRNTIITQTRKYYYAAIVMPGFDGIWLIEEGGHVGE